MPSFFMDFQGKKLVRHWLPRLLGIAPLLVFCLGLFAQGGPLRGLLMVGVLVAIIAGLLILYMEISHLAPPSNEPRNPLLRGFYAPLVELLETDESQLSWPMQIVRTFLCAITASPYSGLASLLEDLEFSTQAGQAIELDLEQRLNPEHFDKNQKVPGAVASSLAQEEQPGLWSIDEINGQSLNSLSIQQDGQPGLLGLPVEGGRIVMTSGEATAAGDSLSTGSIRSFRFQPKQASDANAVGRFSFRCRAVYRPLTNVRTSPLEDQEAPAEEYAFPVYIWVKPASSASFLANDIQNPVAVWQSLQSSLLGAGLAAMATLRWLISYLLQLRIQVAIALLCWLLFQTQQVRDVLLAMILDQETQAFVWATAFGVALCLLLWHSSRQLTRMFPAIHLQRRNRRVNTADRGQLSVTGAGIFSQQFELLLFWISWLSIALFTVPMAREAFEVAGAEPWLNKLVLPYGLFLAWALFIGLWHYPSQPYALRRKNYARTFSLLFLAGLVLPLFFQFFPASLLPRYFGSVAVLFWALCMYLIVMTTIFRFSVASGFPLLSLLLVISYLLNINRLNDNHAVRIKPLSVSEQQAHREFLRANHDLPPIEEAFAAWLSERQELLEQYTNKPFPVYVISAQGGGIYAAYHTAKTLARLSEEVPGFEKHVFAISGVSGGSVGSTIYAMALRSQVDYCREASELQSRPASLGERIESYFEERDALATILASLLFGDITQRFFPLPVASWDRALGLELSFENRNANVANHFIAGRSTCFEPIRLNGSFYFDQDVRLRQLARASAIRQLPSANQLAGEASGVAGKSVKLSFPNLVLNTTEVENGRRFILAPFSMEKPFTDADFHQPWRSQPGRVEVRDLRFSTAAGLSARFPVASPYGFFADQFSRRFVDGGLYDNSGAITAREIVNSLNSWIQRVRNSGQPAANPVPTNPGPATPLAWKQADGNPVAANPMAAAQRSVCFSPLGADACRRLEPLIKSGRIKVIPLAIVDKKAVELNSNYANPAFSTLGRFRWIGWSPVEAVLSSREARLQKASDEFLKDDLTPLGTGSIDLPGWRVLLQKEFRLGNERNSIFSVPLGWKISCQARAFINDQLQPQNPQQQGVVPLPIPCDVPQASPRHPILSKKDPAEPMELAFPLLVQGLRQETQLGPSPAAPRRTAAAAKTPIQTPPRP